MNVHKNWANLKDLFRLFWYDINCKTWISYLILVSGIIFLFEKKPVQLYTWLCESLCVRWVVSWQGCSSHSSWPTRCRLRLCCCQFHFLYDESSKTLDRSTNITINCLAFWNCCHNESKIDTWWWWFCFRIASWDGQTKLSASCLSPVNKIWSQT